MTKIGVILGEKQSETIQTVEKTTPKTSIGRELMNNLLFRVRRRGNALIKFNEKNKWHIEEVRIDLSSDARHWIPGADRTKNFSIMVKPFIRKIKTKKGKIQHFLMLDYNGVNLRASDIFGSGINRVIV